MNENICAGLNWFEIRDKINQRERQILLHSYLYYVLDTSVVDDSKWSQWAEELEYMLHEYPEEAKCSEFFKYFKDFDHSTGANLVAYYDNYDLAWVPIVADMTIRYEKFGNCFA